MKQVKSCGIGYGKTHKPSPILTICQSEENNNKQETSKQFFDVLLNSMEPDRKGYVNKLVQDFESKAINRQKTNNLNPQGSYVKQTIYKRNYPQISKDGQFFDDLNNHDNQFQNKSKPKLTPKAFLSIHNTPKNSHKYHRKMQPIINGFQTHVANNHSTYSEIQHKSQFLQQKDATFISQIDQYLEKLKLKINQQSRSSKTSLTVKSNEDYSKLMESFQNSLQKIKQLKLKNHLLQKERMRRRQIQQEAINKQKKMKSMIYKMMNEIKFLNLTLNQQKKQKNKLQKVISTLQVNLRNYKPIRNSNQINLERLSVQKSDISYKRQVKNEEITQEQQQLFKFTDTYHWKSKPKIRKSPFLKEASYEPSYENVYYSESVQQNEQD